MKKLKKIELYTHSHTFSSIGKKESIILKFTDQSDKTSYSEASPLNTRSCENISQAREALFILCKNLLSNQAHQFSLPASVMFAMTSGLSQLQQEQKKIDFVKRDLLITNKTTPNLVGFSDLIKVKIKDLQISKAIDLCKYLISMGKKICVDCNGAFSLDDMLFFSKHFKRDEIEYLEEPASTYSDLVKFSQQSHLHWAVDESLYHHPIERLKTLKNLKLFILKPTLIGGATEHKAIIEKCYPVKCTLSSSYESAIGITNIIALAHTLDITQPLGIDTCRYAKKSIIKNEQITNLNSLDLSKIRVNEELLCPLILQ